MLRFRVKVRELGFFVCLILFGVAEFLDGEDGRKPWISSLAVITDVGNRKAEFASARQSVSVHRSTVQRSAVKRSMSGFGNASYDVAELRVFWTQQEIDATTLIKFWNWSNLPFKLGIDPLWNRLTPAFLFPPRLAGNCIVGFRHKLGGRIMAWHAVLEPE
ncbi:hypothetical protein SUGI_1080980 [Cryptomeria japonica]|nr:hypothetical protein SUGI_1080980 [Cryptomeria japonica]